MIVTTALNCYNQYIKLEELDWEDFIQSVKFPDYSSTKGKGAINWGESTFELTEARRHDGQPMLDNSGNPIPTAVKGSRHIINKCALTYDFDELSFDEINFLKNFLIKFKKAAALYSTFSYNPEENKFRYRLTIPLNRTVSIDEWKKLQLSFLGIWKFEKIDESCLRENQWMFKPVHPEFKDPETGIYTEGPYDYLVIDEDFLDVDEWFDNIAETPIENYKLPSAVKKEQVKSIKSETHKLYEDLDEFEPGDPRRKNNIIGAFCRVYPISLAITEFDLPYEEVSENNYKYKPSHSPAGAWIKNEDTLFYSLHQTDPAYGSDKNAFDLTMIHKFADSNNPYLAMVQFARNIPAVAAEEKKYRNKNYKINK